jgi:hypothetical protein
MKNGNGGYKTTLLKKGWWICATVSREVFPRRAYVGQIQEVDAEGIRLTRIDWFTGMASGFDLLIPWRHLDGALVCTDKHDHDAFYKVAGEWETAIDQLDGPEGEEKAKPPNPFVS